MNENNSVSFLLIPFLGLVLLCLVFIIIILFSKHKQEVKRKPREKLIQVKYSRMPTVVVKKSTLKETFNKNSQLIKESIEIIRQIILIFTFFTITWFLGFYVLISITNSTTYTVNSFIISFIFSVLNLFLSLLNLLTCLLLNNYTSVRNKLEKLSMKLKSIILFKKCNKKKISEAQTNDNQVVMTAFSFKSDSFISKIELNNF